MKPSMRILAGAALGLAALLAMGPGTRAQNGTITINVAGSTLAYPYYSKAFAVYHQLHPNLQVNYASIGSGGGIRQLFDHVVDMGASDAQLDDQQMSQAGFALFHFPTVVGGAVPIYNIPGVDTPLKFTGKALAGIYLGTITKWNDPAITKQNPGVKLPDADIITVHRSDGSGTTFTWTGFLSQVSPEWQSRVGHAIAVRWPVGLGGKGSEGVVGVVKQTPDAIGYADLIYALQNNLLYGEVENPAGIFVKATLESTTVAAGAVKIPADFRVSITNAPGRNAFPVSTFTFLLVPQHIADATKRKTIKDLLHWVLTDGQKYAAPLSYAPLPKDVAARELQQVNRID